MSVAAGLAWVVAHDVLHHAGAFFAPIAAVTALGLSPGKRVQRAVELVFGVALGVLVGDLLVSQIGTGAWQIGLVVLLAVALVLIVGGGTTAVSQAAGSAVLIATIVPPSSGFYTQRAVDAMVGGAVGIAVLVVAPGNLSETARRRAHSVFLSLAAVLDEVAAAIDGRDVRAAELSLRHARTAEETVHALSAQLDLARENARIAPRHWCDRETLDRYAHAALHLEYAIRDVRVLARAAVRLVELVGEPPAALPHAVRELRRAALTLEGELSSGAGRASATIAAEAAGQATAALAEDSGLAVSAVVAQVRSTATDLLRASGLGRAEAVRRVRDARR